MTWTPLTTLTLTADWQYTPETEGYFFRVKSVGNVEIWVAARQADISEDIQFWGFQRLVSRQQFTAFQFNPPPVFEHRRLAFRDDAPNRANTVRSIQIEVSDMPLSNPANVTVNMPTSATVTPSTVTSATTSNTLLAANSSRKGVSIWNNSTATLYVELGATASSTVYTVKLDAGGYYETPYGYTGAIAGSWSAANGNALVREFS